LSSIDQLEPDVLVVPEGFHRALGVPADPSPGLPLVSEG
ncbi:MAG: hypothetical protein JWR42_663, partial [Marmoricola sp.]|nr:hypothetical protein [Marmoricola sp.]